MHRSIHGFLALVLVSSLSAFAQDSDNIGHTRHLHRHGDEHPRAAEADGRFMTSRDSPVVLDLPREDDAFFFVVFGDRTGGPTTGVSVLADAVRDTNLLEPDFVMTVGDLVQGYNQTPQWIEQMLEFKQIMDQLVCPWFPVAGNHDIYWRGPDRPEGEHEHNYEMHFGPLWYAFTHKNCGFIALYSDEGDPETGVKDYSKPASNVMSDEQRAWLGETLGRFSELDHVFVFLHHPRWLGGGYGSTWEPVHKMLVQAGNVTAVFAGHIHRMRSDARDGIEYISLATVGGAQSGVVPEAGYVHQFHVVTVRREQIALASIPVGQVMDVREITGEVSRETAELAQSQPKIEGAVTVSADGGARGQIIAHVANPTSRAIDVAVTLASEDNWWTSLPDHAHARIEPGASRAFSFRIDRFAGVLNDRFRPLDLVVSADYLCEGHRYAIPETRRTIPMEVQLPAPARPEVERVIALDGRVGHLAVPPDKIAMDDGPLTLECWMKADSFAKRTGLVAKTENSEYGLFVSGAHPGFSIHLNNAYVDVVAENEVLEPGRWYHIAGVFDGREVRLYVNGSLVGAAPGTGVRTINALPLIIGGDVTGRGTMTSPFDGMIDAVRLSATARYSGEHFEPQRRWSRDDATVLLLNFDGKTAIWLYDESGRGAHPMMRPGVMLADQ